MRDIEEPCHAVSSNKWSQIGTGVTQPDELTSSGVRFSREIELLLCTYLFLYLGERLITLKKRSILIYKNLMLLLSFGYVVSFSGYKAVDRYRVRTGCVAENNAVKCRAGGDESDVLLLMSDYNPRGRSRAEQS